MVNIVRSIVHDRLFQAGLLIKLLMILVLVPQTHIEWFVPFVESFISGPHWDPWSQFLKGEGNPLSYPYGPVMLLLHVPGVLLGTAVDVLADGRYVAKFGYRATLLLADFAVLLLLLKLHGKDRHRVVCFYWLSPIVIFVTYWNGQNDILPVMFLVLALMFVTQNRPMHSGVALGLAIATKMSMVLGAPFIVIYFWKNQRLRHLFLPFATALCATFAVIQGPYLLSPGVHEMLFQNREMFKIYWFSAPLGADVSLYVTPLAYLLTLYAFWQIPRANFDLLQAVICLSFFLVILMTPAAIGWYVWLVPLLVMHQLKSGRMSNILTMMFAVALVSFHFVFSSGANVVGLAFHWTEVSGELQKLIGPHVRSLWMTLVTALGLILFYRIYREGVRRNDFYRIGDRPVSIGVSGDSGSGKDQLSLGLAGLFGEPSIVHVSGDDYHLWDRQAPIWKSLTHLNPRTNDLYRFTNDVMALMDNRAIMCRRYNHKTGRFSKPVTMKRNDVILVSGLHALYSPALSDQLDVTIYLDPDENLRRYWKVRRDVGERQHSLSSVMTALENRMPDSEKYVRSQMDRADVVFSLLPVRPLLPECGTEEDAPEPRLRLCVRLRDAIYYESLARVLIAICGLQLDVKILKQNGGVELHIEGDVMPEDIELATKTLVPNTDEILGIEPNWCGGMTGVMHLVTITQISHAIRYRS